MNSSCAAARRLQVGDATEAVRALGRAVQHRPNHAASYNNLALLAHEAGDSERAIEHFYAALKCDKAALALIGGAAQVSAILDPTSKGAGCGAVQL